MQTAKNERLEQLSDQVRIRIPVSFDEALEVIEYQEMLKKFKPKSFIQRLLQLFEFK